jgi:phage terminase small subunit
MFSFCSQDYAHAVSEVWLPEVKAAGSGLQETLLDPRIEKQRQEERLAREQALAAEEVSWPFGSVSRLDVDRMLAADGELQDRIRRNIEETKVKQPAPRKSKLQKELEENVEINRKIR